LRSEYLPFFVKAMELERPVITEANIKLSKTIRKT
jgi:hypothetical protein